MNNENVVIDTEFIRIKGGALIQLRYQDGTVRTVQLTDAECLRLLADLQKEFKDRGRDLHG